MTTQEQNFSIELNHRSAISVEGKGFIGFGGIVRKTVNGGYGAIAKESSDIVCEIVGDVKRVTLGLIEFSQGSYVAKYDKAHILSAGAMFAYNQLQKSLEGIAA